MFSRKDILARFKSQVAAGKPIIGGGAGTGISAKCAEAGGIDLIIIYNSGRFRMAGRGSLAGMMPYGDANQIVMDMAREVLPVVENTPVLAGVCGTDPFRIMKLLPARRRRRRASAACRTSPPSASSTAPSAQNLEETDMGYGKEVDMIALARELGLLTCPYVFTTEEADGDGEGRRGRAHPAHGPDHQGDHRREDRARRSTKPPQRVQALPTPPRR